MKKITEINKLKLIVWVVCDATIIDYSKYNSNSNKKIIQFHLSRQDKIKNLCKLLDDCEIKYTIKECKKSNIQKLTPYFIRIYGDFAREIFSWFPNGKHFDYFKTIKKTNENILCIAKELAKTDGCYLKGNHRIDWKTTDDYDCEIIKSILKSKLPYNHYKYKFKSGFNIINSSKPFINRLVIHIEDRLGNNILEV